MPCVGGTSALPMEGEGNATGGGAAASHVGYCVFCVVVFCPDLSQMLRLTYWLQTKEERRK